MSGQSRHAPGAQNAARRRYGKNQILFGGIDKRALADGPQAIDRELERVARPLLARGGYFPILDHCAPPGISFEKLKSLHTAELGPTRKHECLTCCDWSIKLVMYEDHERLRL